MKTGIISILGVILLVLTPSLPASASGSGAITITMTGVETVISIALDKTNWPLGDVTENTEYKTDSETSWCTITNTGNVNVDLGINGKNAQWLPSPEAYSWFLSTDGTNNGVPGFPEYVLWYHIAMDTEGSYTLITHDPTPMQKADETTLSLEPEKTKQFGLKLLTPVSFPADYIGKEMTTHITISVVSPP